MPLARESVEVECVTVGGRSFDVREESQFNVRLADRVSLGLARGGRDVRCGMLCGVRCVMV